MVLLVGKQYHSQAGRKLPFTEKVLVSIRPFPVQVNSLYYVQSHKRFKRTLLYYDTDNLQIFRDIPFIKPQNDT